MVLADLFQVLVLSRGVGGGGRWVGDGASIYFIMGVLVVRLYYFDARHALMLTSTAG